MTVATYWRNLEPLYEGCDGLVRLTGLERDGQLLTDDDLAGATVTLTMKASETAADADGTTYQGDVQPGPIVEFAIPKADLSTADDRWGAAVMVDGDGRHAIGRGPLPVAAM